MDPSSDDNAYENAEAELALTSEWVERMFSASAAIKGRVLSQLKYAEQLYNHGFETSAVISAWTAFEIYSGKVIVRSILGAVAWPFDELGTYLFESIFDRRNGKLRNLRRILEQTNPFSSAFIFSREHTNWEHFQEKLREKLALFGDAFILRVELQKTELTDLVVPPIADELWKALETTQILRNDLVHEGIQTDRERARQAIDSVWDAIRDVEKHILLWSLYL